MIRVSRTPLRTQDRKYTWFPFILIALIGGCTPEESGGPQAQWRLILSGLPGGLLSVSGTSPANVYAVGADSDDGKGPLILKYDGTEWSRLESGATGGLWWISDRRIDDSFFMAGEHGLVLRYRPDAGTFEQQPTPSDVTLFGIWGERADNVVAVGGNVNEPDMGGVIWHFDGEVWSPVAASTIEAAGIPVLFKVWGRSETEIYAVGAGGVMLRFDGAQWARIESATSRTLFTVHGNQDVIVATGGAQSGVIVESASESFNDVTPAGALQMNGTFVTADGYAVAVGREGAVAFRRDGQWTGVDTGLNLDPTLDYHATWIDPAGGIWAVGGNIVGEPQSAGMIAYFGTQDIGANPVGE